MVKTYSKNQLERYPVYLKVLREMREEGERFSASSSIARRLGYSEEQVKKDLAAVSPTLGTPGRGRDISSIIEDIETFLGYREMTSAVIVGVGRLGSAILDYPGFADMGLDIVAGFDSDPAKIGTNINGREIYDVSRLSEIMPGLKAHICIIAVPSAYAQSVADMAVKAGATGIWNFAPTHLSLKKGVIVENVNLASSLAVLSHRIKTNLKED